MVHPAAETADRLLADCMIAFTRRSGPGGQNRNKVETAVVLTHRPTGIVAEANEARSQAQNRMSALFRLRIKLALQVRGDDAGPRGPTPLWRSRTRGGRIVINPQHDDFPTLLAEALDALERAGDEPAVAAESLGCSATQFLKFLKLERRAFAWLNDRRRAAGRHPFL